MNHTKITIVLMSVLSFFLVFNQWQIVLAHEVMHNEEGQSTTQQGQQPTAQAGEVDMMKLAQQILPSGVPQLYGEELGVSFDQAAAAIPILAAYEQDSRNEKLTGEKLSRYIKVGQSATCEFCCGATTMVFPDGRKACGCAHSAAMRGVAAYLLDNYGDQLSDEQIITEVNKWKAAFFPGPMTQKVAEMNGLINTGGDTGGLQRQVGGC